MAKQKTELATLGFGTITRLVTKADFVNRNEFRDLLNVVLESDDQILISLSEDPDELSVEIRSLTIGRIRNAISNFELPYSEKTGNGAYRFPAIRVAESPYGKLFPQIGTGNQKRVAALFSLVFFNYVVAYNLNAKLRINDLAGQKIQLNQSTYVSHQSYRNHYASGCSIKLDAIDELFLHPKWANYIPDLTGSILFKDVFFREGVIAEFLGVHSSIREQTFPVIPWNDSPFERPINTDGGNFITTGAAYTIKDFKAKKPGSRERIVQILPACSVDKYSMLQTSFIIVNSPMLYHQGTGELLSESDTHETFLLTDTRSSVAQIALTMCVKDSNSRPNQSDSSNSKTPKSGGKKSTGKGQKSKSGNTSLTQGTPDNDVNQQSTVEETLDTSKDKSVGNVNNFQKLDLKNRFAILGGHRSVHHDIFRICRVYQKQVLLFSSKAIVSVKQGFRHQTFGLIPKLS